MIRINILLTATAMIALAGVAKAQEKVTASSDKFYAGVSAGVVIPEDVKFTANASQGGATASAAGKFEFANGYSVSGFAGYRISRYLRAEGELAYAQFDYDKISGTMTITQGATTVNVTGSADIEGQVRSWVGIARGIVTPFGRKTVTPLVGVGAGFAAYDDEITRVGGTAVNASSSHTDLALDGTLGLEVTVTSSVDLGARYRYMWVDSGGNGIDDFTAHNITATAAYRF